MWREMITNEADFSVHLIYSERLILLMLWRNSEAEWDLTDEQDRQGGGRRTDGKTEGAIRTRVTTSMLGVAPARDTPL